MSFYRPIQRQLKKVSGRVDVEEWIFSDPTPCAVFFDDKHIYQLPLGHSLNSVFVIKSGIFHRSASNLVHLWGPPTLNFFWGIHIQGCPPKIDFLVENFELQKFPTSEKIRNSAAGGAYELTKFESNRFSIRSLRAKDCTAREILIFAVCSNFVGLPRPHTRQDRGFLYSL